MLVDIPKQNDVNLEGCLYNQHARTALTFVMLKRADERKLMFYRNSSADMLLTVAERDLELIHRAKVSHSVLPGHRLGYRNPTWTRVSDSVNKI